MSERERAHEHSATESHGRVDLDLLAEYAAGLLDPAQAAEIERLVATDSAWADTLAALTDAAPRVQAALSELGAVAAPADVVARLDAAIARPDGAATTIVDISTRRARGDRSRRGRWRWSRGALAATGVAAAIAVIVGGLALRHNPLYGPAPNTMSAGKAAAAPNVAPEAASGGLAILATGTDYTPQTLASAGARSPAPLSAGASAMGQESTGRQAYGSSVPQPLTRLAAAGDRQTCLNEVTTEHGGVPTVVDYARYRGEPAMVVVLSVPGAGEVVVVGPDCGLPGSGSDQIYAVPLR
jgi:anti-sigma-K factor RskA